MGRDLNLKKEVQHETFIRKTRITYTQISSGNHDGISGWRNKNVKGIFHVKKGDLSECDSTFDDSIQILQSGWSLNLGNDFDIGVATVS
jgi:hypothetical protein